MLRRLLVILILTPFTLYAQQTISLQDCLRLALNRHPALREAEALLKAEQNARRALSTTGLPSVHLQGTLVDAPVTSSFGYDPALSNEGEVAAQAQVQETLYDGGARSASELRMDITVKSAELETERQKQNVIADVTAAYIDVLRSGAELAIQSERIAELGTAYEMAERRWNSGTTSYTDLLKTKVSRQDAEADAAKLRQERESALTILGTLTGNVYDSSVTFSGSLSNLTGTVVDSLELGSAADPSSTLDARIDSLTVEASGMDVEVARSEMRPQVSLIGDIGYLSSLENLKLPSEERSPVFGYSIGVNVSQLLFNWGGTSLRVQEGQLRADALRAHHDQLRLTLTQDLRTTVSGITWAGKRLRLLRHNLVDARNAYTLIRAQYAGGGTTSLDVLTAEQELTDIRIAEIETLAELQRSYSHYLRLTSGDYQQSR
jgi:outer membrane protein